jgi:predicted dinucleotide-binding enzyme
VRDPNSAASRELLQKAGSGTAATMADAAKSADVLLVSTPWAATQQVIESLGDLSGKIVIDVTNPLLPDLSGLALGTTTSAAEQVAQWASGARVVKAFNTIGFNVMADPSFGGNRALLLYCGDDAAAKQTVKSLAAELGFDPQDAGLLRQARLLEPFAPLWISLAYGQGYGREFAFQLLRR